MKGAVSSKKSEDICRNVTVSLVPVISKLENLDLFRSLYSGETEDPMKLLSMVGLEHDARTRVSNFSKGMKMRLNFIRAILNRPKVLFLDEPTSGLDPVNARLVKEIILQKKAEGVTIFLTTHNMYTADVLCDRVAFITDGKVALIDSPRELKVNNGDWKIKVEYRSKGSLINRNFPLETIGTNRDFLSILTHEKIETIHTLEASLEDIFIETTGRRLI
jgi:fluoroquinolone transport system ATP-binding protein